MLSGSPQDVSRAKAEIDGIITKVHIKKLITRFFFLILFLTVKAM